MKRKTEYWNQEQQESHVMGFLLFLNCQEDYAKIMLQQERKSGNE